MRDGTAEEKAAKTILNVPIFHPSRHPARVRRGLVCAGVVVVQVALSRCCQPCKWGPARTDRPRCADARIVRPVVRKRVRRFPCDAAADRGTTESSDGIFLDAGIERCQTDAVISRPAWKRSA